jgi:hypothetical protein
MKKERRGEFELGDIALRIFHSKLIELVEKVIIFEIEWKEVDGFKPLNSYYTNRELRIHNPALLCKYYERKFLTKLTKKKEKLSRSKRKSHGKTKIIPKDENKKNDFKERKNENFESFNKRANKLEYEDFLNYIAKNKPPSSILISHRKRIFVNYYDQYSKRTSKSFDISHVKSFIDCDNELNKVKKFTRTHKLTK